MGRDYLGEFEHLVLLAILRLGEDAYGVTIRRTITQRAGRPVSFGAVYSTLRRMESKGLVTARLGEPASVPGGRAKRYFELTAEGIEAIRGAQGRLARMADGLELFENPSLGG